MRPSALLLDRVLLHDFCLLAVSLLELVLPENFLEFAFFIILSFPMILLSPFLTTSYLATKLVNNKSSLLRDISDHHDV